MKRGTFRDAVRREARRQGLSGYRIAKLSGVPMRTVQRYLAGETVKSDAVEKISAALGLELRRRRG